MTEQAKPAGAPLSDPIRTSHGCVAGTLIGEPEAPVRIYRGIPYAAAPQGELRWKAPQPAAAWDGIRECTTMPPSAPQAIGKLQIALDIAQSEDCLNLNVLTPARRADESLPVMVWLHGGAYIHGNGNEPFFNAPRLPQHGVVLVNVNMRVGPVGLLAHPLLSAESAHGVSGNYMLLDMIAALQWVRDNIAAFGGNPANVTIFGESGGGGKVLTLISTHAARGLFHKAIVESGGVLGTLNGRPLADNESLGQKIFAKLGVDGAADPLAAARALPWRAIIDADRALVEELDLTITRWNTTIDGWLLPKSTAELIKSGAAPNWVPVIAGCNLGEIDGSGVPYLTYPSLIEANINVATSAARAGHASYVYLFDRVPHGWRKGGCVSFHRLEPGYVFGDWDDRYGFFRSDAFPLARASGAKQTDPELDAADRRVSEAMMEMWSAFARTGKPSSAGAPTWPHYESANDRYLLIVDPPTVKSGYSQLV
ncbi:MAG: carboxylesterase/lipase family protein [Janthinobacterium lividum]